MKRRILALFFLVSVQAVGAYSQVTENATLAGAYDNSLATAVSKIGTTPKLIAVDVDTTVSTAVSVPRNITLAFRNGVKIVKAGSGSIAFQGLGLADSESKIPVFSGFASGDITFTGASQNLRPSVLSTELWDTGADSVSERLDRADKSVSGSYQLKIKAYPRPITAITRFRDNRDIEFADGDYTNTANVSDASGAFCLGNHTHFHGTSKNARIYESLGAYGTRIISITADIRSTITNLEIDHISFMRAAGSAPDGSSGTVGLGNAVNSSFHDNVFDHTVSYGIVMGGYGDWAYSALNSEIRNNTFIAVAQQPVALINGRSIRIVDNLFDQHPLSYQAPYSTIDIEPNTAFDYVEDVLVSGNTMDLRDAEDSSKVYYGIGVNGAAFSGSIKNVRVINNWIYGVPLTKVQRFDSANTDITNDSFSPPPNASFNHGLRMGQRLKFETTGTSPSATLTATRDATNTNTIVLPNGTLTQIHLGWTYTSAGDTSRTVTAVGGDNSYLPGSNPPSGKQTVTLSGPNGSTNTQSATFTGTLPSGSSDYYAIVQYGTFPNDLTGQALKLASTLKNAAAGIAIDLTSQGTGVVTITTPVNGGGLGYGIFMSGTNGGEIAGNHIRGTYQSGGIYTNLNQYITVRDNDLMEASSGGTLQGAVNVFGCILCDVRGNLLTNGDFTNASGITEGEVSYLVTTSGVKATNLQNNPLFYDWMVGKTFTFNNVDYTGYRFNRAVDLDMTASLGTYPVQTFAPGAVNTATGVITITGHGYVTGARVSVSSTVALPAALQAIQANYYDTKFYVIRVDANTFKLANTKAQAFAGTAINIRNAGTGLHSLTGVLLTKFSSNKYSGNKATDGITLEPTGTSQILSTYDDRAITDVADIDYTALPNSGIIVYASLTTSRTVTLPTATTLRGKEIVIKDGCGKAAANHIVIDGFGTETIDGSETLILSRNWGELVVKSDGRNWFTLSRSAIP